MFITDINRKQLTLAGRGEERERLQNKSVLLLQVLVLGHYNQISQNYRSLPPSGKTWVTYRHLAPTERTATSSRNQECTDVSAFSPGAKVEHLREKLLDSNQVEDTPGNRSVAAGKASFAFQSLK